MTLIWLTRLDGEDLDPPTIGVVTETAEIKGSFWFHRLDNSHPKARCYVSQSMGDICHPVDPDDPTIPPEIWAALAEYWLTQ